MNKYKEGDKIIITSKTVYLRDFTVGKIYEVGGIWHDPNDEFYLGIVANDYNLSDGFPFDLATFELAQSYLNEQKIKKLLGVE